MASYVALAKAPLQDAVDLGEARLETALLKQRTQYRTAVNRVHLTQQNPTWLSLPIFC
ncbi:MAG: tail fiber assembly protein [Syntrophorhabdales bacterium]